MDKELNNIALCYHGMTSKVNEKSNYITYIEDFKEQIDHLVALKFKFVKPSEFYKKYISLVKPTSPIATIIFDDALDSISLATMWLAEKSIPFGIAVIGQRLCKLTPEDGYASWSDINAAIKSGFCEILHHTYNMHHFCLIQEKNNIINSPILEGPCYVDNGDFIYKAESDTRNYWDMSHINNLSWGFPLFGTDTKTDKVIESTVEFKASTSISADRMRVWACLHNPYGSGYSAKVQIRINDRLVADSEIEPQKYETRSQWPEREFVTIPFENKYEIIKGNIYRINFVTKNTGNATFMIYAIPDFSGGFKLTTSCTEMTFPEEIEWPARAGIIMADGTGKTVTANEFQTYVRDDLKKSKKVINKYLNASWSTKSTGYKETNLLSTVVLGGTYSNGQLATTQIKIHTNESFIAEILRFKYAARLGNKYPLVIDILINNKKVGVFEANWWDWQWQVVEIDSYSFIADKDYIIKFVTKNESPFGQGLVRAYMEQPKSPQPTWSSRFNKIILPPETEFVHEALYEVTNPEGTDVYPVGAYMSKGKNFTWVIKEPYDGPGKVFIEILSCTPGKVGSTTQICYPFGSYYSTTVKSILVPKKEDIHPDIKGVLTGIGVKSGFSVWDNPVSSLKNSNLKYSEFIMPRYLIEGNTDQTQVIKNIDKFTGYK